MGRPGNTPWQQRPEKQCPSDGRGALGRIKLAIIGVGRCASETFGGGPLVSPSVFLIKHPPQQFTDDETHRTPEKYIGVQREP